MVCSIATVSYTHLDVYKRQGYGRAIRPVHTMADGDSIYAVSVGRVPADINLVGPMSAYVMAKAIANAARSAKSVDGYKAFCDVNKK